MNFVGIENVVSVECGESRLWGIPYDTCLRMGHRGGVNATPRPPWVGPGRPASAEHRQLYRPWVINKSACQYHPYDTSLSQSHPSLPD